MGYRGKNRGGGGGGGCDGGGGNGKTEEYRTRRTNKVRRKS